MSFYMNFFREMKQIDHERFFKYICIYVQLYVMFQKQISRVGAMITKLHAYWLSRSAKIQVLNFVKLMIDLCCDCVTIENSTICIYAIDL